MKQKVNYRDFEKGITIGTELEINIEKLNEEISYKSSTENNVASCCMCGDKSNNGFSIIENGESLCVDCMQEICCEDISTVIDKLLEDLTKEEVVVKQVAEEKEVEEEVVEEEEEEILTKEEQEEVTTTFKEIFDNVTSNIEDKIITILNTSNEECVYNVMDALHYSGKRVKDSVLVDRIMDLSSKIGLKMTKLKKEKKEKKDNKEKKVSVFHKLGELLKSAIKVAIELTKAVLSTTLYTAIGIGVVATKTAINVGMDVYDLGKTVVSTVKKETKKTSIWQNRRIKKDKRKEGEKEAREILEKCMK